MVDANHPLAGQTVALELRIAAVRPALSAEIEEAAELLERGHSVATGLLPAARLLRRPSTDSAKAGPRSDVAPDHPESVGASASRTPSSSS